MYRAAQKMRPQPGRWPDVEKQFLKAMWDFDVRFASGKANHSDNQNGKGDFFTDLIALLLEGCSGKELYGRGSVPGLIFPKHNLDSCYPAEGTVEVLIETKVAGAPKGVRNPLQKNPAGRMGSAYLDKHVKETGLKTIDLKAEWARMAAQRGGPTSDLISWLRSSKPLSFLFMAIRVMDKNDLTRTIYFANAAARLMDGVGVVAYQTNPKHDGYVACRVEPHLELDRVLARVCTALRNLP
jgi:hypothetical protein